MSFESLGLDASILKAVADQGYTEPTPIQKASIPTIIEGQTAQEYVVVVLLLTNKKLKMKL